MKNGTPDDAELAEQRLNAARFKCEIAQAAGGLLDAADALAIIGVSTEEAVYQAAAERRLLAVENEGELRFPSCQFGDSQVLPGIQAILGAAPNTNGWRVLQYLYDSEEGARGRSTDRSYTRFPF